MPSPNRTCVANATHKTIMARVNKAPMERRIIIRGGYREGRAEVSYETRQEMVEEGFTLVHSRNWTGFYPGGNSWFRGGTVYVTVYTLDGQMIAYNHPVNDNYSVLIVTNTEGLDELKVSRQGDVWTDDSGRCHKNW